MGDFDPLDEGYAPVVCSCRVSAPSVWIKRLKVIWCVKLLFI